MNDLIKEYLLKKKNDEGYNQAKDDYNELNSDMGMAQFAAGVGNSLARRDPNAVNEQFNEIRKNNYDSTIGQYQKDKANAISEIETQSKLADMDSTSAKSIAVQNMVKKLYPGVISDEDLKNISAKDSDVIFKPLELKSRIDAEKENAKQRLADRNLTREMMLNDKNYSRSMKQQEEADKLKTPYGPANTYDDAKQLKEAAESKANFDRKINEMIQLRQDKGAEVFDREAVARGKQLSKDLLLEYKNMAKLGVLSQSDENIINAIIPSDPLEWKAASIVGQDPILHQLKKFKEDSDADFNKKISTRTKAGLSSPSPLPIQIPQSQPITKKVNGKTYQKVSGGWQEI